VPLEYLEKLSDKELDILIDKEIAYQKKHKEALDTLQGE
jgi:hypothetical protein